MPSWPAVERDLVLYGAAGGVATITLNRPERLNSWTGRMNFAYRKAVAAACVLLIIVASGSCSCRSCWNRSSSREHWV